ncbi:MAG: Rha family transcriptional regulator [bacterium]
MTDLQVINHKGQLVVDSREVAEIVDKEHKNLLRDIKNYCDILTSSNLSPLNFFLESTYKDQKGEIRPCYLLTKKGCDMVANKMTGEKGVIFTAAYIDKFYEMEDKLKAPALDEDFERRKIIGELIRDSDNESRPYIIQLFKDYLPEPKPLKPNKVLDRRNKSKVLVISENKFADFLEKHSLAMRQVNRGTKISRRILRGLYHQERPRIRISTVERLCNFLNCSPDELFICE